MSLKELRAKIPGFPRRPGVYLIDGRDGKPIYIGKANDLVKRLASHFRESARKDYKEERIQTEAVNIRIIETASEAEALLLESSLVKQYAPRYNKELRDDKSYPFLKLTMEEEYPRLLVVRGRPSDGSAYFGPFTSVKLLRQAVSFLRRQFPMRTCDPIPKRVCLMYHIGQCRGPCEGHVDRRSYMETVKDVALFLEGRKDALVKVLARRMREASAARRYEEARMLRDQIQALSSVSVVRSAASRLAVLDHMQAELGLSRYPRRVECFDISNFSGKNPVGSMVVFEDGLPMKTDYRRFKIRSVTGIDDYAMMKEVVRRRYERLLAEKNRLPDLVLIDGGRGHLSAAKEVLDELNLADLDIVSIAKQHEHLFKPGRFQPVVLPQSSPVLQLIRRVRDEAHRFAIRFYRRLHRKEIRESELDAVPGVGPKRKTALLKAFRTIDAIRRLTAGEIAQAPGVDRRTAERIEEYFKKG